MFPCIFSLCRKRKQTLKIIYPLEQELFSLKIVAKTKFMLPNCLAQFNLLEEMHSREFKITRIMKENSLQNYTMTDSKVYTLLSIMKKEFILEKKKDDSLKFIETKSFNTGWKIINLCDLEAILKKWISWLKQRTYL